MTRDGIDTAALYRLDHDGQGVEKCEQAVAVLPKCAGSRRFGIVKRGPWCMPLSRAFAHYSLLEVFRDPG